MIASLFSKTSTRIAIVIGGGALVACATFAVLSPTRQAPAFIMPSELKTARVETPSVPVATRPDVAANPAPTVSERKTPPHPLEQLVETMAQPEFAKAVDDVVGMLGLQESANRRHGDEEANAELRAMETVFRDRLRQLLPPRPGY